MIKGWWVVSLPTESGIQIYGPFRSVKQAWNIAEAWNADAREDDQATVETIFPPNEIWNERP